MADTLERQLIEHTQDAFAMEQNSKRMLESMIETTEDPEIKQILEHHHEETERHEELLKERLDDMGEESSTAKDMAAVGGAMFKGVIDRVRDEKPGRNARDGYVTEHLEIASYEMLGRLAERSGDSRLAEVARRNCADERAMAEKIEQNWDKFVAMSIEAGESDA